MRRSSPLRDRRFYRLVLSYMSWLPKKCEREEFIYFFLPILAQAISNNKQKNNTQKGLSLIFIDEIQYIKYKVFTSQIGGGRHNAPLPVFATGSKNMSILLDFFSV